LKVDLAIARSQQKDSESYAAKFKDFISAGTPMVGNNSADVTEVHTTIIQPHIDPSTVYVRI